MLKVVKRLLAAAAVVCALLGGAVTSAQTNIYFGACGPSGGNGQVVPLKHAGTGCPTAGSWLADTLAVGTDGVLCWSTVAGSPGTWVQVGGGGALDDLSDVGITTPTAGQVLRRGASSWANATLAYSELSGTPTIPDSGADVGLADSPSSDGDYVLRRASGTNTWAAASGGPDPSTALAKQVWTADGLGGASWLDLIVPADGVPAGRVLTADGAGNGAWQSPSGGWIACTSAGLTSVDSSDNYVLATCMLPTGWLADGAHIEYSFDVLCTSNPSSVPLSSIAVGFANTANPGDGYFQLYGVSSPPTPSPGTGFSIWGEAKIVDTNLGGTGIYWARGQDVYQETHQAQSYYQEMGPMTSVTRITLNAYTSSGTIGVSAMFPKIRVTTPQ